MWKPVLVGALVCALLVGPAPGQTPADPSATAPKLEEQPSPEPMVDPFRDQRLKQRDAWRRVAMDLRREKSASAALTAAWATFHEFDVDYFYLAEGDGSDLLDHYERQCKTWIESLGETAPTSRERLVAMELRCILDDIEANRLQYKRPEGAAPDAAEVLAWDEEYERFQAGRVRGLQNRGKLVATLFREGEVDALRICVALLERQIAERVLAEHQQDRARRAGERGDRTAQRRALLKRHRQEWTQLDGLIAEHATAVSDLGSKACHLHGLMVDLLLARLDAETTQGDDAAATEATEKVTSLTKRLFGTYQDLHRAAAASYLEAKLSVEQLARVHDLRMYTTIWSNPALDPADVAADAVEVAEVWKTLHDRLAEEQKEPTALLIARAKHLEAEIDCASRQGNTAASPPMADAAASDADRAMK